MEEQDLQARESQWQKESQILQPARPRNKRQKYMDKKPRYESRKMVLDQAQKI